ncbi:MAG: YIP1 family protein [Chloroflexi bacterium]|nr:YIP1 family protein [Chloroflexota bacterium]
MQQVFEPSLFTRMQRAAMLDRTLYDEVEHDLSATNQAATVVVMVAVANGIAGLLSVMFAAALGGSRGLLFSVFMVLIGMVMNVVGWIVWSYLTYWIGTTVFKGTATPGELLRTLGFASTPALLGIASFIPCLGALAALAGTIWMIVAGVVAVRQALDVDTGQAVITVILAAIPLIMISLFLGFITFLGGMAASAF